MKISDVPKTFVAILAFIGAVEFYIWFHNWDKTPESVQNELEKQIVPTEISWLKWITEHFSNPLILLILIFFVLWLFGYIPTESKRIS